MTEPDGAGGLVWSIRGTKRRFRSWVRAEEESYAFLVMWVPLTYRERQAFELYEGLDELAGRMPVPVPEIADTLHLAEETVRELVRVARRKIERYYRAHGLVVRRERPKPTTAAEALDRLRQKANETRCPAPSNANENS